MYWNKNAYGALEMGKYRLIETWDVLKLEMTAVLQAMKAD